MPTGIYERTRASTEARFLAKVDDSGDCWLWTGALNRKGYGNFWSGERYPNGRTVTVLAHRWSYEQYVGSIPEGHYALHHCDTPACVRPSHLFTGTQAANMADMRAKGRARDNYGERNINAALTAAQVAEIRHLFELGGTSKEALGRRFGVNGGTIGRIVRRETWAHVETRSVTDSKSPTT